MIKNWLSRYTVRYPRSLVYMLQATEYHIRDYVSWYHRTRDFSSVERRKQLVKTPKSLLLLAVAWIVVLLLLGAAVFIFRVVAAPFGYVFFFLILFLLPYVLAYGIVIPLVAIEILVQWPVEVWITRETRKKLEAHKAVKIGIAGSFGKTTMREILKTVLSEGKTVAAPPHSYNTSLGINAFVKTLKGNEEVLIFELGEYYSGDVRKLCKMVQPDMGIITGVNEAHLQKFKTLERTAQTVFELADYLGTRPVYVNGENERARKNAGPGHMVYDREKVGNWKIENPKTGLEGTTLTLVGRDTRLNLTSGLLGMHQIGPLAAACHIALRLGLSPRHIMDGVARTKPFDHRLNPATNRAGVTTLDDSYNGNPDGVAAAIDFLASLKNCRRWYVTPGLVEMGARAEEVHREIGKRLGQAHIERVVLIKNSVTSFIEQGLQEERYKGDVIWFDDALAAFAALPHLTVKGDVVLLQNDWPDQYQ